MEEQKQEAAPQQQDTAEVVKLPDAREVRAEIRVTLFMDGNFQVDGPFDDMLMYHGLLGLANHSALLHVINEQQRMQREAIAKRSATGVTKKPGLFDRFRIAREAREAQARARKAREDMEAEQKAKAAALAKQAAGSPGTGEETTNNNV